MALPSSEGMPMAPDFPAGYAWLNVDHPLQFSGDLRGRIVILDFWTYCCINCMHVLPDLEYLEHKYANDPVVIIGVHSNKYPNESYPANVREAIRRYGITHPVVVDEEHTIWDAYGVSAWPTLVVVDASGRVLGQLPGEGHREQLDFLIAALLDQGHQDDTLAEGPLPTHPVPRPLTVSGLLYPGKVLADPERQRLYLADSGHHRILITDPDGEIQGFFGSGRRGLLDGAYEEARFSNPQGMARFGGALYIADTDNHAVRRADLSSFHVDTVAGNGMIGYDRHGGHHGREQVLNSPWDLAALNGQLFIAMAGLHQIWALDLETGEVRVVVGTGRENIADNVARKSALAQTSGLSVSQHILYFADSETSAVRQYNPADGLVATLVGKGLFVFGDEDGPLGRALLQHPLGVAAQGEYVYVADTYNHKIRLINLHTREVSTLLGTGQPGREENGRLQLYEPGGLSVAGNDLYIADTNNHRIIHYRLDSQRWREITPTQNGTPLGEL